MISLIFCERSDLDFISKALLRSFSANLAISAINVLLGSGADQSHGSFAASFAKSLMSLITFLAALCPSKTASNITFSLSSFASDSTISTASLVPATTKSSSDSAS